MRMILIAIGVLVTNVARAESPAHRARKIVTAQVAALTNDDPAVIAATFAPDAVVTVAGAGAELADTGLPDLKAGILGSFHAFITNAKLAKLTAGGNNKVVWIAAEIALTIDQQTSETSVSTRKSTVRLTELAVAEGGKWKIVAAQFAPGAAIERDESAPSPIEATTAAGPLAKLLVSPTALASGLGKDPATVVFGTDKSERGVGAAAATKLVGRWAKLQLAIEGGVREVRTATYGFVQANVNWVKPGGAPYRMRGFLIALPGRSGTWTVVAAHYAVP